MPAEVYEFMELFPQPTRAHPSVEYSPLRTEAGRDAPRDERRPARAPLRHFELGRRSAARGPSAARLRTHASDRLGPPVRETERLAALRPLRLARDPVGVGGVPRPRPTPPAGRNAVAKPEDP